MDLLQRFKDFISAKDLFHAKDKLLLAISGGVDSTVLCHLCKEAGFDFSIAHCNFQLRGEDSDRDEQFVKELAGQFNVAFYVKHFDTKAIAAEQKKSIETAARDLRYQWFDELLKEKQLDYVVTAHHADDNIETVTMNFFRGTGIKGIRGILPKNNKIVRPLLFARRNTIEDYAWLHQLTYVSDATNLENAFTRNFFRNRIIPEVQKFYPETGNNILHNIARFAETEQLYNQAVTLHKSKLIEIKDNEVHIPALKLKKTVPLHTITYEIIKDFGFSAAQTGDVMALLESENGKFVASSSHRIIRNRNWLIIAPVEPTVAANILIESAGQELVFEKGTLRVEKLTKQEPQAGNQFAFLDAEQIAFPLLLRKWKAGDYFYPLGMKKKKKLARFLIDQKLSKTEKENVWVIESNKKIAWVVGHRIDDRLKVTEQTSEIIKISLI